MNKTKLIAELLLQPTLTVLGGPCKDWRHKVRLFSYGLLTKEAEPKVITHVRKCQACRLFLLQCFNVQSQVASAISSKRPAGGAKQHQNKPSVQLKLGKKTDTFVERIPPAKTQKFLADRGKHSPTDFNSAEYTKRRKSNEDK